MFTSLNTRLKRAGQWLPVALLPLLPFAAQAQSLNYAPAGAVNVAGAYADLGTTGTAIATANTDDANSAAQPIGFTFGFNGATFTQFVLNTNGFLKLGAAAPSATALFLPEGTATNVDPFRSTDLADVNLVVPFNVDLTAGNGAGGAEYRVTTTGTAPNQVCTIQWKNLSDKASATASQYANFSFQVKLYETTNNVEFVYDAPVASAAAAVFRSAQAGLKGSGFANGQFVQATKQSATAWSDATFANAIINNTLNTLNFRNNINPVAGTTYRFAPTVILNNDAAVTALYTLGKVSSTYGSPVTAQVVVTNPGSTAQANLAVTLTVSGATTFTNTQTVATLAAGASTTVNFTYPVTGTGGTNTLTATVPADDLASNNSRAATQTITSVEESHFPSGTVTYTGGIGSATTADILLLTRYQTTSPASITTVTPTFAGTGTATNTYQVVIYSVSGADNAPGTLLYTSPTRTRPATAAADAVAVPDINVNGDFFVGVKQLTSSSVGLAFLTDAPLRPATFYISTNGTAFTDLATTAPSPRLAIDVTLGAACGVPTSLAVTGITATSASLGFTAPAGATSYTVTTTPAGGTATTVTPAPTAAPVALTGLTPSTTYTVSVTTNCAAGQTSAAVTTTFTTLPVAPANDLCSAAIALTCGVPVTGTTVSATTAGDPTAVCAAGSPLTPSASPGVFYSFAGNGQVATVSTCSGPSAPAGDTKVFVYSGSCGALTCVGSSDDFAGCGTNATASSVTFPTVTGTNYYIFVQFFGTATGAFGVNVTCRPPVVTTYATLPVSESFEGPWIDGLGTRDLPGASWRNSPADGDASWRRDNDGTSASWGFAASGSYTPASSQGTRSARFHSYGADVNEQGRLDLYVNLSGGGAKTLTFDYINSTGTDKLEVLVSTDGGATFGATPVLTATTNATFTAKTVTIPSTSATTVIRFQATSDFGDDDIGIDNVQLRVITATRNAALAAAVGLYPNPARQRFTLEVPAGSLAKASATLLNALGQAVHARRLALPAAGGTAEFDVSGLAPGVYSLRLQTGNDLVVKRVVVE
ncbi:T9SS type A sorting domain-containing protein [Hymenobacter sp.]|uniref:T9SS type A sorting domain-containing protein n=1 Tax=Hymenobacter sp. TaxID=1898978 RepID=UPI00286A2B0E|nr:T9SS type A sorting domain-containing protein [Hymenobacter sp.]